MNFNETSVHLTPQPFTEYVTRYVEYMIVLFKNFSSQYLRNLLLVCPFHIFLQSAISKFLHEFVRHYVADNDDETWDKEADERHHVYVWRVTDPTTLPRDGAERVCSVQAIAEKWLRNKQHVSMWYSEFRYDRTNLR